MGDRMSINDAMIEERIKDKIPDAEIILDGEGCSYKATIISRVFDGMTPVKKHQAVYATVNDLITSGELHALTIKTFTPEQWQSQNQ